MSMNNAGGVDDHGLNPVGATTEKPMEQTAGQRIAERWMLGYDFRADIAAAIDEAIADARQAGDMAVESKPLRKWIPGHRVFVDERTIEICEMEKQLAAKQNITGDNLCWITDPEQARALPEAEFLESCRRYRQQIADERGEFVGGRTIAQLEEENANLRKWVNCGGPPTGKVCSSRKEHAIYGPFIGTPPDGPFTCEFHNLQEQIEEREKKLAAKEAECAAMREALLSFKRILNRGYKLTYEHASIQGMTGIADAALASNAGEALLARLRAAEKARDEHLHYIQHGLNPQLEAACDAITDVLGGVEWDGIPATIRLIGARLRAAEEKAAALDWLGEHGAFNFNSILDDAGAVEYVEIEYGSGHDAARGDTLLAAIQAARAKEPK